MSTFSSEFDEWLQEFRERDKSNLDKDDLFMLSHVQNALHKLQLVEWGLTPVYNENGFYQSLPLIEQQKAGMIPESEPYQKADFQVLADRHILDFLALLHFDHTKTYLSDCFKKITRVEAGDVISTMKKDEHRRETEKRKKGGQKSHDRKEFFKNHICDLANNYLEDISTNPLGASCPLKVVCSAIYDNVTKFLQEHPELPQSKRDFNHPNVALRLSRTITDTLSHLKKEGRLIFPGNSEHTTKRVNS